MSETPHSDEPTSGAGEEPRPHGASSPAPSRAAVRRPSRRTAGVLAGTMLAVGVALGAAIGPAPEPSLAGASGLASRLPALIAALASGSNRPTTPQAAGGPEAEEAPVRRRHRRRRRHAAAVASNPEGATSAGAEPAGAEGSSPRAPTSGASGTSTLPQVTSVWLIELDGGTFAQAAAQPTAVPYIHASVLPQATLLSGWSALQGQALASEAALAVRPPSGAAPPLLHQIVQPPCPEGPAGAGCAPETPGQLTAADQFLQATLAQITGTATYREHGLIVITFTNVGVATQAGLPAGASTATLTSQPPGGVALMSPFARAGVSLRTAFDTASPVHTLEGLLHR